MDIYFAESLPYIEILKAIEAFHVRVLEAFFIKYRVIVQITIVTAFRDTALNQLLKDEGLKLLQVYFDIGDVLKGSFLCH